MCLIISHYNYVDSYIYLVVFLLISVATLAAINATKIRNCTSNKMHNCYVFVVALLFILILKFRKYFPFYFVLCVFVFWFLFCIQTFKSNVLFYSFLSLQTVTTIDRVQINIFSKIRDHTHPTAATKLRIEYHCNMKTNKVVILRHGESEFNKSNLFCGWHDAPLTEKGMLCMLKPNAHRDELLHCWS